MLPDRLEELVKKIEAGKPVTQADVDKVASLQGLDIARMGRQVIAEQEKRENEQTAVLVKAFEGLL